MKKKALIIAGVLIVLAALAGLLVADDLGNKNSSDAVLYVSSCADCTRVVVSRDSGSCACGKDLVAMHVLKQEGNEAVLCACGKDCSCTIDEKNPLQCGCGKPVRKVSLTADQTSAPCKGGSENCPRSATDKPVGCGKCSKPCRSI